jgi:hypothetical protein
VDGASDRNWLSLFGTDTLSGKSEQFVIKPYVAWHMDLHFDP